MFAQFLISLIWLNVTSLNNDLPFSTSQQGYFAARVNGKAFTTVDPMTDGLFNPLIKKNTFSGEDAAGTMISVSFPPELQVNQACSNCEANITIKKNNARVTYYSKNISNFQCRLTIRKGNWIEGVFSFTAKKASNDIIEIKDGKFGGKIP
jgi:hypothetical protein